MFQDEEGLHMLMRRVIVMGITTLLTMTMIAEATLIELYSADDYQYFGTGAVGADRSQRFSPSQSTPNSLNPGVPATAQFDRAAMKLRMGTAGESANVNLTLYPWVTDYATSLAQTPIAQLTNLVLTYPSDDWVELSFAPRNSSGQYLLSAHINSMTYVSVGFGVYRSNSNDGGTNNDAYNNSTMQTNREYQVRLNAVPEPVTLCLLAMGGLGMVRRRRA
jgi:hypothetical protein